MEKKLSEVNILRAIACISVILIHVTADPVVQLPAGKLSLLFSFINRIAKPSVPIFIFISGLTLFNKYKYEEFKYLAFLRKRILSVLVPYILWTVVYYILFIKADYYNFSVAFLVKALLLGNMVYHLYFIPIILQFYMIFGIFLYCYRKYNPHVVLGIFIVLNILFIKFIHFPYTDRFFMTYISFFALGCYISANMEAFREQLFQKRRFVYILFAALSLAYTWQFYSYNTLKNSTDGFLIGISFILYSLISIIFLYRVSILADIREGIHKLFLNGISNASFYIYLAHPLALMVSEYMFRRIGFVHAAGKFIINLLFIILAVFPLSILYYHLKSKYLKNPAVFFHKLSGKDKGLPFAG